MPVIAGRPRELVHCAVWTTHSHRRSSPSFQSKTSPASSQRGRSGATGTCRPPKVKWLIMSLSLVSYSFMMSTKDGLWARSRRARMSASSYFPPVLPRLCWLCLVKQNHDQLVNKISGCESTADGRTNSA
ncbi:uncharacterized protein PV09_00477 [Verruconis gallopava]|uniref:Uncharacterized protein n=1 Tax=Verruconis gallopava TaxID=253628 RepID=A0A0D2BDZ4_9PEZI|nr:uncharacterized protein PV09_00477 [Verruconis gallopava]KIW09609.1 hypothetical protein PV09_00477 [Verruconis gallopava]